jgi:hypothetical protein
VTLGGGVTQIRLVHNIQCQAAVADVTRLLLLIKLEISI